MLSVKQTASRLNVSESTIYALIQAGQIKCHRVGVGRGVIRMSQAAINDYLRSCEVIDEAKTVSPRTPRKQLKHIKL